MKWDEHVRNRNQFPYEELLRYENQHVAWSLDGNRILASDEEPLRLDAKLSEAGYKPDDYILSYVDFESHLGGAALSYPGWETAE